VEYPTFWIFLTCNSRTRTITQLLASPLVYGLPQSKFISRVPRMLLAPSITEGYVVGCLQVYQKVVPRIGTGTGNALADLDLFKR